MFMFTTLAGQIFLSIIPQQAEKICVDESLLLIISLYISPQSPSSLLVLGILLLSACSLLGSQRSQIHDLDTLPKLWFLFLFSQLKVTCYQKPKSSSDPLHACSLLQFSQKPYIVLYLMSKAPGFIHLNVWTITQIKILHHKIDRLGIGLQSG